VALSRCTATYFTRLVRPIPAPALASDAGQRAHENRLRKRSEGGLGHTGSGEPYLVTSMLVNRNPAGGLQGDSRGFSASEVFAIPPSTLYLNPWFKRFGK